MCTWPLLTIQVSAGNNVIVLTDHISMCCFLCPSARVALPQCCCCSQGAAQTASHNIYQDVFYIYHAVMMRGYEKDESKVIPRAWVCIADTVRFKHLN